MIHLNSIGPLFLSTKKKEIRVRAKKKKLHTHTAYYLQTLSFNSQNLLNSSCKAFFHIFSFFTVSSCVPLFISNRFVHFNVKNVYCCCEHTLRILQITEKNQPNCLLHTRVNVNCFAVGAIMTTILDIFFSASTAAAVCVITKLFFLARLLPPLVVNVSCLHCTNTDTIKTTCQTHCI